MSKNAAKIYAIPRGKGMLPIWDMWQTFLTTSVWPLATYDTCSRHYNAGKPLSYWELSEFPL